MRQLFFLGFVFILCIEHPLSGQTAFSDKHSYVTVNCNCNSSIGIEEARDICNQPFIVELPTNWCLEPGNTLTMKQVGCGFQFTFKGNVSKMGSLDATLPNGRRSSPQLFKCTVLKYPYEW